LAEVDAPLARERIVVGIDVGTTKVATLIAEVNRSRHVHVIGVGVVPSRGLNKGEVVDIEQTVESIAASVRQAERVAGYQVSSAHVGITGSHVASLNNRGVIAVAHQDRTITADDVARVVEAAQVINVPSNRQILHAIPRQFIVDGQDGIRNPVAMSGYRLDVEVHIVTGGVTAIQNFLKCFQRLQIQVEELVLQPLAASEAVLTDEEREMGVALVDVGGGTTEIAVFVDGSVCHTEVIRVGGNHLTNDLAVRLRTPFAEAEQLKINHAHAYCGDVDPEELVEVATFGRGRSASVPRVQICEVAEARLQETFQLIHQKLQDAGCTERLAAGVVLVGGAAQLSGIAELGSEILCLPVRQGAPRGAHGLVDTVAGPAYAASVGLVLWGARHGERVPARSSAFARDDRYAEDGARAGGRIKGWLRAILP
jgi:cell division protein FtsA